MRNGLLRACGSILAAIEKDYFVPGLQTVVSEKEFETKLSRLFGVGGLPEMMEGKTFNCMDSVFSILAAFID